MEKQNIIAEWKSNTYKIWDNSKWGEGLFSDIFRLVVLGIMLPEIFTSFLIILTVLYFILFAPKCSSTFEIFNSASNDYCVLIEALIIPIILGWTIILNYIFILKKKKISDSSPWKYWRSKKMKLNITKIRTFIILWPQTIFYISSSILIMAIIGLEAEAIGVTFEEFISLSQGDMLLFEKTGKIKGILLIYLYYISGLLFLTFAYAILSMIFVLLKIILMSILLFTSEVPLTSKLKN